MSLLILFIVTFKKKEVKMLKRIILARHGQSSEDIDPTLHNINSGKIAVLTDKGKEQANQLGLNLKTKILQAERFNVYVSPALRAQETWMILSAQINPPIEVVTDSRIRNLNWGNITLENRATIEAQRYESGVLNFTFPEGDHTPDYINSLNNFIESVVAPSKVNDSEISTLLFITHGFALRVILKHLLVLSEKAFQWLRNPPNCHTIELVYDPVADSFSSVEPLLRMDPI